MVSLYGLIMSDKEVHIRLIEITKQIEYFKKLKHSFSCEIHHAGEGKDDFTVFFRLKLKSGENVKVINS